MPSDQEFIESVEALATYVGTKRVVEDEVGLSMVRRISGMLDEDPDAYVNGTLVPPHWFGMFFSHTVTYTPLTLPTIPYLYVSVAPVAGQ